jgi:hypothetical protein
MNLIDTFQDLVARVPDLVQPLIVALAGAVPFIEGEGAAAIGIIGGIHPVIAATSAVIGNFACVALLVLLGAGARQAVTNRVAARDRVGAGAVAGEGPDAPPADSGRTSPRADKFRRAFERYGVPGVSLLGPLLLPTQFNATMLAASGVGKARILVWQAAAIVLWTSLVTLIITGVISAVR